jgi:quercetin dioxygenase-like cupin family protein
VIRPEKATRYWLVGGYDRIVLTAAQTAGGLGVTLSEEQAGDSPPLHVHTREDETFVVLDGVYTFFLGAERISAPAGTVVFAPRGIPHSYRIESPTARYLCFITPGGFERFFSDVGLPADDPAFAPPDKEPDFERLGAVAETYGVTLLGPALENDAAGT